jgi:hypothetical protein
MAAGHRETSHNCQLLWRVDLLASGIPNTCKTRFAAVALLCDVISAWSCGPLPRPDPRTDWRPII